MTIDRFFYEYPIFRHEEFVTWKLKDKPIQLTSVNMALQHYINKGQIIPIRRKLYVVIPPNQTKENVIIDPYLIAAKLAPDSILAYHTALELHGLAYSAFSKFNYLTIHKNKSFEYHEQWFQALAHPKQLQSKHQGLFAVKTINRQGIDIQITNIERTFVDVLDRVETSGGWEEILRSINKIAVLNYDEVIKYTLMLENARLAAKVGYFLEQRQGAFAISEKELNHLLLAKPKIPQYISNRKEKSQLVKKWNLIIPIFLINKSWEEPHVDL